MSASCLNLDFPLLGSSAAAASEQSAQLQDTKIDNLPDTKAIKQKGEIHSKRTVPKEAWPEEEKSLQIDIAGNGERGRGCVRERACTRKRLCLRVST